VALLYLSGDINCASLEANILDFPPPLWYYIGATLDSRTNKIRKLYLENIDLCVGSAFLTNMEAETSAFPV